MPGSKLSLIWKPIGNGSPSPLTAMRDMFADISSPSASSRAASMAARSALVASMITWLVSVNSSLK